LVRRRFDPQNGTVKIAGVEILVLPTTLNRIVNTVETLVLIGKTSANGKSKSKV
jgi:hypothetical protein